MITRFAQSFILSLMSRPHPASLCLHHLTPASCPKPRTSDHDGDQEQIRRRVRKLCSFLFGSTAPAPVCVFACAVRAFGISLSSCFIHHDRCLFLVHPSLSFSPPASSDEMEHTVVLIMPGRESDHEECLFQ